MSSQPDPSPQRRQSDQPERESEPNAPGHRLRRVGAELLAGAAAVLGIVLVLRRRNRLARTG